MKLSLQPLMTRMSTSMLRPFAAACLVAAASLAWTGWASAAPCSSTNYRLTTQAEVDALGVTGCESVSGYLYIQGASNSLTSIKNLDGLANLTSVGGTLTIYLNYAPTNLDGLANLTSVGGYLKIEGNDALTNLDGLANLTSVGGYLRIYRNYALTNLDGLANLTSVGGDLLIAYNDALTNLDGLANLTSVGGYLEIEANDNASCEGLALLLGWPNGPPDDDVDGDITIAYNGSGCNSVAEVLASYNPPITPPTTPPTTPSDRFNALLQAVQAIRGAGSSQ
jgi:hypothetical protein